MPDDANPQPRRRISDRDRRRWSDSRLDDFKDATERRLEDLERFERVMAQIPGLMQGIKEKIEDTQEDVRSLDGRVDTLFARNFKEHAEVKSQTEEIAQKVTPSRLDWALKFATIVSVLLVPILAAYVASGG